MNIVDNRKQTKIKVESFMDGLHEDVYILGTNKYGNAIALWLQNRNITVSGYINDYIENKIFNNLPVVSSKHQFIQSAIINCIVEGRTIDAQKNIEKLNPLKSTDYFGLQYTYSTELPAVDFLTETDEIIDHKDSYIALYNHLSDETSKQHLERIINFRLNRDINFLKDFEFILHQQYFEEFVKLKDSTSFVDGGGFDGATTKQFVNKYPNFIKIFYFEPTEKSFQHSMQNLKNLSGITYFKKGLWNKETVLRFDETLSSANKITKTGSVDIETVTLDEVINEPIGYVKFDIEGAEKQALVGAKNIIKKYKPKLAICVYHNQSDFLDIPEIVLSYHKDYKIYLRHYTQGVFETVMYFV
ncbi:FkbM family methyltransferase [Bizionia paragorgiae]|uniref:FkbM family methyltransferase n=1 Tax=Bizionia paragorgiae TaxID=283786 RepID=UPI003A94F0A0